MGMKTKGRPEHGNTIEQVQQARHLIRSAACGNHPADARSPGPGDQVVDLGGTGGVIRTDPVALALAPARQHVEMAMAVDPGRFAIRQAGILAAQALAPLAAATPMRG